VHGPEGAVDRITLRMLLSHTSGFQAPTGPWDRDEPWEPFEPTEWSQLVAMMPYQRLEFAPGSRYGYSNPGYIYLARVVEQLTGDRWAVYVQKNVRPRPRFRSRHHHPEQRLERAGRGRRPLRRVSHRCIAAGLPTGPSYAGGDVEARRPGPGRLSPSSRPSGSASSRSSTRGGASSATPVIRRATGPTSTSILRARAGSSSYSTPPTTTARGRPRWRRSHGRRSPRSAGERPRSENSRSRGQPSWPSSCTPARRSPIQALERHMVTEARCPVSDCQSSR
jgi:CubicO group peptidase (beta-lactamase class C family)